MSRLPKDHMFKWLGLVLCAFSLFSCTSFTKKRSEYYWYLANANPQLALQKLENATVGRKDQVLYELDKAMLLRLVGDFAASNALLESAKQNIKRLSAISISENLASVTINEMGRSYIGQPFEQILIYVYKTLNFLALGDIAGARVEVLQADAKLREWSAAAEWEGVNASITMRYLSGIVFEMHQEWSEALIAYRKAYEVFEENSIVPPHYLQKDLLRLTHYLDLKNEYLHYLEQFSIDEKSFNLTHHNQSELIILFHQGLVSRIYGQVVSNFSPDINNYVQIAIPVYSTELPPVWHSQIQVADKTARTMVLQNIDRQARNNLALRTPGITARAMVRVLAKKSAAHNANKEDAFAGFLVGLAGILTEQADTRSWTSLPATVQIARLAIREGRHALSATIANSDRGGDLQIFEEMIAITSNEKKVISIHDITAGPRDEGFRRIR